MARRTDALIPIEADILLSGVEMQAAGFYGFQLAKQIRAGRADAKLTAHGTLYKALARLTTRGLLETWWEDPELAEAQGRPRRRMYRLSGAGALAVQTELAKQVRSAPSVAASSKPSLA